MSHALMGEMCWGIWPEQVQRDFDHFRKIWMEIWSHPSEWKWGLYLLGSFWYIVWFLFKKALVWIDSFNQQLISSEKIKIDTRSLFSSSDWIEQIRRWTNLKRFIPVCLTKQKKSAGLSEHLPYSQLKKASVCQW